VVLSYAYWHGHFHGDPGIVGRVAQINKHPLTIIGRAAGVSRHRTVLCSGHVDSDG